MKNEVIIKGSEPSTNTKALCLGVKALFAEMLYTRRQELGISQAELARQTGIDRCLILKIEKGQRLVSMDVMILLINALQLDFRILESCNFILHEKHTISQDTIDTLIRGSQKNEKCD